ncbi:MAG: 30S ribosomal protein S16 [Candidatus Levybacteria bacterium RIFCSPHIGHO2_02_FULL_39_36]|nr:MAG: 30S ribosomal protein S16 [Candidatus Levybacteria bacterium GW2011_GWA1_39_11]KKR25324.1 MAG: 30S ribosomal protein S16 [Candidatus Levybacteria bacterium GW2011_GWB1_39_7]KKR27597.1 MAG: 30S ribosomal protein S16 [Microgenomates group bacterium GW2011_GWC1_39_7]KKR50429.1 MAG: 30S ribosomal protein S16 [Candidatus Levybacteria bacterium GW2011_GWA2_40_16]OGH14483.1 MAG: 30S ribosomal protein S16 [Candidatus Levybacteria bacterium RIFCSPHIGHO2_01_FULL_38_96]OGH25489.1 MAG: 30S ribosom
MLVIRLSRIGRKGEAKYRVVVKEKRSKRDGAAVDFIGFYEKSTGSKSIKDIDLEKLSYWKSKGAQLSPAVEKIISE